MSNEFEGRFKDQPLSYLKARERKVANDADAFRRELKQYNTPERNRDLRTTTDLLHAIRKEIQERTGQYGYYESALEKDSSPTSKGWFGESQRHSEAARKGKGNRVPLERRKKGIPPFYVTESPLKENSVFTPRESLDLYRWRREQAHKKQARLNILERERKQFMERKKTENKIHGYFPY